MAEVTFGARIIDKAPEGSQAESELPVEAWRRSRCGLFPALYPLVPVWFHLRFPLVVPLPLGFSIGQGGHTGKMPGVALAFVVLQQEKVPLSRARTGTFARGA